jgi:hypothetical protein
MELSMVMGVALVIIHFFIGFSINYKASIWGYPHDHGKPQPI